jgi:ribosomal protein S18 acetylase RimI-like enzyme
VADTAAAVAETRSIRKAGAEDLRALAVSLARAFFDDPHASWMFRADERRLDLLERGYTVGLRKLWLPEGGCYTTAGVVGGALWMPPGKARLSVLTQLRLLPSLLRAYKRDSVPVFRLLTLLESMHPHEPEHWYLAIAGVDPEWQGRGIGGALLQPVLERCDADGTGAYVEATTERSRALYARNGFEVTREYRLWDGGPPGWAMWREPRADGPAEGTTAPA